MRSDGEVEAFERDGFVVLRAAVPADVATGGAGDVFLCHPFLVHRATWPHRGTRPRVIAQPPVLTTEPFRLHGSDPSPVARAIVRGLERP